MLLGLLWFPVHHPPRFGLLHLNRYQRFHILSLLLRQQVHSCLSQIVLMVSTQAAVASTEETPVQELSVDSVEYPAVSRGIIEPEPTLIPALTALRGQADRYLNASSVRPSKCHTIHAVYKILGGRFLLYRSRDRIQICRHRS